jgi:ERCC4-type nuclease
MSDTETLVPYLKKKRGAKREPTIIVDSREANTAAKIVKGLLERSVNVEIRALQKGDYVLSDVCAVERKTVRDFVYTLTHRHLFEQLFKLKEVYPNALILLEGYLPVIYRFSRINPASVWGAMFNLVRNGVSMINTTSYKETVDFLYIAARQEQIVAKRAPVIHPIKKSGTTSEAQIFFVSSLPNVGRERAAAILKSYHTPLNALVNVHDWAKSVHGLGPKISRKAEEVLTKPYT